MRRYLATLPFVLLAACSPASPPPDQKPPKPQAAESSSSPDNATLGSVQWYAWVDDRLHITDDGHGPDQGSAEWNHAVQAKLGQEAPQSPPGSPQWQQAVDALLRTRPAM